MRWVALVVAVFALSSFVGCGSSAPAGTQKVTGKVTTTDGQPVKGASVGFSGKYGPSGTTGDDGSYTLSTFEEGDGAPDGEYSVTISSPDGGAMNIVEGGTKVTVGPSSNKFDFKVDKAAAAAAPAGQAP
jgi:hypothetical protein